MPNDGTLTLALTVKDWRYLLDAAEWRYRHLQDISRDKDKEPFFPDISEEIDRLEILRPLLKKAVEKFGEYRPPEF